MPYFVIVKLADFDDAPSVDVIAATVLPVTTDVVIVNLAEVFPAGTTTFA